MKRIAQAACLLLIFNCTGSQEMHTKHTDYMPEQTPLLQRATPKNTVIAFDLHEVLFARYPMTVTKQVLKAWTTGGLWLLIFNPFFWHAAISTWRNYSHTKHGQFIWEDYFTQVCSCFPKLKRHNNSFMEIATTCSPIPSMVELLKQLKERGYYLVVLSNIGSETYKQHAKKFPAIMNLFDAVYTPSPEIGYVCKPQQEFYEGFKQFLADRGHGDKEVLFIDDLPKNIEGAERAGISGILCKNPKEVVRLFRKHKLISHTDASKIHLTPKRTDANNQKENIF